MDNAIIAIVVVTALAFDFTNGFHDTANAMATTIATKAMPPRVAVALAGVLNAVGAFLSLKVAATIAEGIVKPDAATPAIIFAGLMGAIVWNLATWYLGLPSSSSHALIGGVVGAMLVAKGTDAIIADGLLSKVIIPALIAPILAGLIAGTGTFLVYRLIRRRRERVTRSYKVGQVFSGGLVALAHGTNDAQKTMGVITLALVAGGQLAPGAGVPDWVVLTAAASIALGTYAGGWRIIRTMGHKLTEIEPPQGFTSETSSAAVILASSAAGYPLSTTHVVSGGIVGSGVGRKLADVRWGLAGRIALAWLLTLPAAAAIAALAQVATDTLGADSAGPVTVALVGLAAVAALWTSHRRSPVTASDV